MTDQESSGHRRIAVIGGSGFIGSRLCGRLAMRGHAVINVDIQPPKPGIPGEHVSCDVRDRPLLRASLSQCTGVVLLAAEHADNVRPVEKYHDVNANGASVVASVCAELGIAQIVFTSSVALYGLNPDYADEGHPLEPFNPYGRSKLEAERVLMKWQLEQPSRCLCVVRPVVVFGPGNRGNVYNLLRQIQASVFAMVGDGENRKSMAYVENVADFLVHLLGKGSGLHLFNYADKPDLSMRELIGIVRAHQGKASAPVPRVPYALGLAVGYALDAVAAVSGRSFPVSAIRIKKFCANSCVDASKAQRDGFTPARTLAQGLSEMCDAEFPKNTPSLSQTGRTA